jgi:hypothetical protein
MSPGHRTRLGTVLTISSVATLVFATLWPALASAAQDKPTRSTDTPAAVHYDTSPPLSQMQAEPGPAREPEESEGHVPSAAPGGPDGALQDSPGGGAAAPSPISNFIGVGKGFTGPAGPFNPDSAPPDTDGDVGPNHYMAMVNESIAVFSKTGTPVFGPVKSKTLWAGFGGKCSTRNDGDGIVKYDKVADRWIVTQFALGGTPYLECVAVSVTGDPTGAYHRYAFQYAQFPDYPKVSVWPDAYYVTFNMFLGNTFTGAKVCAYDRAKMLTGAAATQQCFDTGSSFGSVLASDVDGSTQPPSGSPNYVVNFGTNKLNLWKFHVDWNNTANSSLSGPQAIAVAAFTQACLSNVVCVPQKGTSQKLDSLADAMMMRFAYRNFGDHESLVVNHTVVAGSSIGVRWYELRSPGSSPTVFQQGTYAPDGAWRWMGSVAMDGAGNIGLGFSVSSSSVNPGIHYTGHLTTDPLGVMGQGETVLFDGTGSQTGGLDRWGDYSAMAVDPSDDCTFWYTNEYLGSNGSFNWSTRIGSFKFPSCPGTPDFSLSATPASQTVAPGAGTSYTTTITPVNGFSSPVTLGVSGLPSGASGSFSPNPATTGSTLSVTTTAATPPGSYPLTITGTSGSLSHSTPVTLVVSGGGGGDFTISASPASRTVTKGAATTYTVTITPSGGFGGAVTLSASGGQAGSTYSFSPNPATTTSTFNVQTSASGPSGTFTITISGTSGSLVHTTTVTIKVGR